jgi:hypothetical protein
MRGVALLAPALWGRLPVRCREPYQRSRAEVLTTRVQAWDYSRDLLVRGPRHSRSPEAWSQDFGVAASPEITREEARRGSQTECASKPRASTPLQDAICACWPWQLSPALGWEIPASARSERETVLAPCNARYATRLAANA